MCYLPGSILPQGSFVEAQSYETFKAEDKRQNSR